MHVCTYMYMYMYMHAYNATYKTACYCFDAQPKAAIEAVILIGVAMVAGSGSNTGLKLELCLAPPSSSSAFVQERRSENSVATTASAILPFLRSTEGS